MKTGLKEIEIKINKYKDTNNYTALWQLYSIYNFLQIDLLSKKYLNLSFLALKKRLDTISNNHDKDYFLHTYDAQLILKLIN